MTGEVLGRTVLEVDAELGPLDRGLATALGSTQTFERKGTMALAAVAAAAGATGAALFGIGKEFDSADDKIRIRTGRQGKDLARLEQDWRKVYARVPADADEVATAVSDISSRLDAQGRPLQRLTKQVLEYSRITETEVAGNTRDITRLFGDWSVATDEQADKLDGLFRLYQRTGAPVGELAQTLVQFGSPLRTLGFDLDFSAAMLARFEKEGVNSTTMLSGLRLAVANLSDPTDELAEKMKKAGITAKEPADQVMQAMDAIRDAPSVLEGNTLAFEIFGRRAGADVAAAVREGRFELEDYLEVMEDGKGTIRDTARDTMDLDERWQQLTNTLKLAVEPYAADVFEGVSDAAKDALRVMRDPDLSGEEKFAALVDMGEDAIADLVTVAAKGAPRIVGAIASGVVQAWDEMSPLGKLFTVAGVIRAVGGRGAVLRAGAGLGGLLGTGIASGAAGSAAASSAATAAAGGGLLGTLRTKLLPVAKRAGLAGVGIALADQVMGEFADNAVERGEDVFAALDKLADDSLFEKLGRLPAQAADPFGTDQWDPTDSNEAAAALLQNLEDIRDTGREISFEEVAELRKQLAAVDGVSEEAKAAFTDFIQTASKESTWNEIEHNAKMAINGIEYGWTRGMRQTADISDRQLERIKDLLAEKPRKGVEELDKAMRDGVRSIRRAMDDGEVSTRKGLDMINELLLMRLERFGIEGPDASKILRSSAPGAKIDGKTVGGQAMGGFHGILSGYSRVDDRLVPLRGGEAVLRPEDHVPMVDESLRRDRGFGLVDLFRATGAKVAGGYAKGGIVPAPGFPGETINSAVVGAFSSLVDRFNLFLTDAYGPGHASPEHTQYGTAIDVVPGPGGSWDQVTQAVAYAVRNGMTPVYYDGSGGSIDLPPHGPGHHAHITLLTVAELLSGETAGSFAGGPKGPAKLKLPRFASEYAAYSPHAAGLNLVAKGLEHEIGRRIAASAGAEGAEVGFGATSKGPIAEAAKRMVSARWGPSQWAPFLSLKQGESGPEWDPTITNPSSGAGGIPQALPPEKMGSPAWPPNQGRRSIFAQIDWMIDYIADVYGTPSGAYGTWLSRSPHWYAKGGFVPPELPEMAGWFANGGSVTASRPTVLGIGERGRETATITRGDGSTPKFRVIVNGTITRNPGVPEHRVIQIVEERMGEERSHEAHMERRR